MIGATPQFVVVPGPSPRALPLSPRWISETSSALVREFSGNLWFLDSYWPENKARALRILEAGLKKFPAIDGARVLDVACGNGYMSFLFARAGFRVNATDGDSMPERDRMFQTEGIVFFPPILTRLSPFGKSPPTITPSLLWERFSSTF